MESYDPYELMITPPNKKDKMIYYHEAEFNSSDLIERLFENLPQEIANNLLVKLKRDYGKDVE